jgi:hypothetical protein
MDYFKLSLTGFNNKERVRDKAFCSIESGKTYVDGYKLTELQVQSVLFNQTDVEDLIKVLQIAKHTFPIKECDKGKKIECAIKVGTIIRYTTNKNWDKLGMSAMVTAYSIPEDKVWVGQQVLSIRGYLENIESGRYEVVEP